VLCNESGLEADERLDARKKTVEERRMKINLKKTEYLSAGVGNVQHKLQCVEILNVTSFKYLGSSPLREGYRLQKVHHTLARRQMNLHISFNASHS